MNERQRRPFYTRPAKLVILTGVVLGYLLGWLIRERLELTSPVAFGLFGMGGVIVGMLAVQPIVFHLLKKK